MRVVNLVLWSIMDFEFRPDQIVDLPDELALECIALGKCKVDDDSNPSKDE